MSAKKPKSREAISVAMRFHIMRRDKYTCQYCGAKAPDTALHVEHVVAVVNGGTNDPDNLLAACIRCNAGKGIGPAKSDGERRRTQQERILGSEISWLKSQLAWFEWVGHVRLGDPALKAVLYAICEAADPAGEFSCGLDGIAHFAEVSRAEALRAVNGFEATGLILPAEEPDLKASVIWWDGEYPIISGSLHVDWEMYRGGKLKPSYRLFDYVEPLCFSAVERIH